VADPPHPTSPSARLGGLRNGCLRQPISSSCPEFGFGSSRPSYPRLFRDTHQQTDCDCCFGPVSPNLSAATRTGTQPRLSFSGLAPVPLDWTDREHELDRPEVGGPRGIRAFRSEARRETPQSYLSIGRTGHPTAFLGRATAANHVSIRSGPSTPLYFGLASSGGPALLLTSLASCKALEGRSCLSSHLLLFSEVFVNTLFGTRLLRTVERLDGPLRRQPNERKTKRKKAKRKRQKRDLNSQS